MASEDLRSTPDLFSSVVSQLSLLFRQEVRLARAEVGEKVAQAATSMAFIAAGGVLLLAALIILLQAAVTFLVYAGVAIGWAQLIVCIVTAIVGFALVRSGVAKLNVSSLTPTRTAEQLGRDASV